MTKFVVVVVVDSIYSPCSHLAAPLARVLQLHPLYPEAALVSLVVAGDGDLVPELVMALLLPDPALRREHY